MTSPRLEVTATVCNFNGGEPLMRCLEALLRQTHPLQDIVVYDNCSEDDSVARVRERFPDVRVVLMENNDGPCPVRNRGLGEAKTPWVLQVDDDVILEEDCLERLVAETELPEVAAVMPRAVFASDPQRVHYDGASFHYIGVMTLRNFFGRRPTEPEEARDIDACIAMALLLRREAVLSIGGYENGYFILFEDHDLSYRLRTSGHRIRLVPSAIVLHDEGTPGISFRRGKDYPWRRTFLHSRNRWMLLLRNHSLLALALGAPGILFYDLVSVVFATAQGNLVAWCKGKIEFFRRLPALRLQRRAVQGLRTKGDRALLLAEPLTHAPMVARSALAKVAGRGIDAVLRGWWFVVRWALR